MTVHHDHLHDEFFPRMILWQLGRGLHPRGGGADGENGSALFTTQECLLTIDSIARVAKPIVVLSGAGLLKRGDLFQIVEYGFALGLKMIVEAVPEELTNDVLEQYSRFGPKVFRVVIDGSIIEDMDTRFKHTAQYAELDDSLRRLRKAGFEIHLASTVLNPDLRQLAFEHDYALQRGARGLYCHLSFDPSTMKAIQDGDEFDRMIEQFVYRIAQMKRLSPKEMYFSPQCIKYGLQEVEEKPPVEGEEAAAHPARTEWKHWCLAGKSFAFIGIDGAVRPCSSLDITCGNLRENRYDFRTIWLDSDAMEQLRNDSLACIGVREIMHQPSENNRQENR